MNLFNCSGAKNHNDFRPYKFLRLAIFVAKQFCNIFNKLFRSLEYFLSKQSFAAGDFVFAQQHEKPTTKMGVSRTKMESWNVWSRTLVSNFLIRTWRLSPLGDAPKYTELSKSLPSTFLFNSSRLWKVTLHLNCN